MAGSPAPNYKSSGETYLRQVWMETIAMEQLSEFITSVFEHHLPWTLGIVIAWVNRKLEDAGIASRLPDELPAAIHFGVNSSDALGLMLAGVRSRRLANRIASVHSQHILSDVPVRTWLAENTIAQWREQFDASPTEILDLLGYIRAAEAGAVSQVLEGVRNTGSHSPLPRRSWMAPLQASSRTLTSQSRNLWRSSWTAALSEPSARNTTAISRSCGTSGFL